MLNWHFNKNLIKLLSISISIRIIINYVLSVCFLSAIANYIVALNYYRIHYSLEAHSTQLKILILINKNPTNELHDYIDLCYTVHTLHFAKRLFYDQDMWPCYKVVTLPGAKSLPLLEKLASKKRTFSGIWFFLIIITVSLSTSKQLCKQT